VNEKLVLARYKNTIIRSNLPRDLAARILPSELGTAARSLAAVSLANNPDYVVVALIRDVKPVQMICRVN
jgi:hypothetical protein